MPYAVHTIRPSIRTSPEHFTRQAIVSYSRHCIEWDETCQTFSLRISIQSTQFNQMPSSPPSFRRLYHPATSFILINKMNTQDPTKLRGIQPCCIVDQPPSVVLTKKVHVLRFRQTTEENNFQAIVKFCAIAKQKNFWSFAGAVKFEGSLLHCVHLSSSFGSSFVPRPPLHL